MKKTVPSCRSVVRMTELVLPSHTNALGTIFGGVVMGWIDIAAAIAAQRYARAPVVTLSIDFLRFISPIKTGYAVLIEAKVTFVGRTSMEIEVKVESENAITGERKEATKAYLTFVAIDTQGKPIPVPPFLPRDEEEEAQFQEGKKRRERRLQWNEVLD